MKRAVTYLRVSTAEQAEKDAQVEGYSIPAQREACQHRARMMEVQIVDEYADQGESARSADRPALQTMLDRLDQGGIDYVIVHKVDRLARNRLDDVTITMRIRQAGAQLVSVSESIDETPSGELLHAIMAANAEFFSKNLALETKKGLRQKFRAGGTVGRAPLGYLNVGHQKNGQEVRTIEFDPERAPLIRWAFKAYAAGDWTIFRLCEELTARGLTTRPSRKGPAKPISTTTLWNILSNPYYVGVVRYEGAEAPGAHEPLIAQETFDRVQRVLAAHANSQEKDRKHPHYLKGSLRCGQCGGRLVLTNAKGNGGTYPYFFCIGRQKRNGCTQRYVPVPLAEQRVVDLYASMTIARSRAKQLEQTLLARLRDRQREIEAKARRAQRRISKLDDERTRLLQAHLADAVPVDVLRREQARLTAEIESARQAIRLADERSADEAEVIRLAIAAAANCAATYQRAPGDVRRLFNQAFFSAIYLRDSDLSGAELTEPYAELLADQLTDSDRNARTSKKLSAESPDREPDFVLSGPGSNKGHKG